jgi:hypothetical protein
VNNNSSNNGNNVPAPPRPAAPAAPTRPPAPLPSPPQGSAQGSGQGGGNEKFGKYNMMRKLNLPEGAIRQKMMTDGLTDAEMDEYFAS